MCTFQSRNIILLGCDLQILYNCLFELPKGLFDSSSLVNTVNGTGVKLLGLPEGLQSCREASAVQIGLA